MAILPNGTNLAELQHSLPQGVRCEITEDCLRLWWRNWDIRKNYGMGCLLALGWLVFTPLTIGMLVAGLKIIRENPFGLICCSPVLLLFGGGVLGITNTFLLLLRSEGNDEYDSPLPEMEKVFGARQFNPAVSSGYITPTQLRNHLPIGKITVQETEF